MTEKKLTAALMLIVFSLLVLAVPTAVLQAPAVAQINADTTGPTLDVEDIEVLLQDSAGHNAEYSLTASDIVDGTAYLSDTPYGDPTLIQDEKPGDIIISCNPPSGSVIYPVGDHRVQCSATDSAGNSAQAAFTIKVRSLSAAGGDPSTVKASLSADPANYEGPCPVEIDFTATITGVGPLSLQYRWTDSDGYLGSTIGGTLIADVEREYRTWELGDINVQPSFQGWMALEIVEPVQLYSNVAWVSVTCTSAIPAGAIDRQVPRLTQSGGVQINQLADNTASVGYRVTAQDDVDGSATLDANNVLTQDGRGGVITISCNPASGSVLPIGDHTVQCSATDAVGRKGTQSFTVSVPGPSATTTPGLSATPAVDTSFTVDITAEGTTTTTGPAPFTFQASASVSGGTEPYTYSWNFGDGQTSNEVSTQHQFQQPGTYNVALTVTDANGNTASDSIAVTVSAADAAAADAATTTTTTTPEEDTTTTDEEGGAATGGEGTDPEPTDETTTVEEEEGGGEGEDTDPEPTDETTTTDEEEEGAADDSGGGGPDGGESQ